MIDSRTCEAQNDFENEDLPRPEFRNISDGFMVTIYGKEREDVGKVSVKMSVNSLRGSIAEVYKLIQNKPELTVQEIAEITGYTRRTIERSLSRLKDYV